MNNDENSVYERLYFRERDRRRAMWKLERMRPGDPAAEEFLTMLDTIEADEQVRTIGTAIDMSIEHLVELVKIVDIRTFRVVLDNDIPEPWRERFNQASAGSTRIKEGCYARDWLKFVSLWPREMAHLEEHLQHRVRKA